MKIPAVALLVLTVALVHAETETPTASSARPVGPPPRLREFALPAPNSVPDADRFKHYFTPLRTERAAISPDGRYLAFSIREDDKLYVITADLDHPDAARAKVLVADDETATLPFSHLQYEPTPARILWMAWATPTRLLVETNRVFSLSTGSPPTRIDIPGVLLGFDYDGRNAGILVTPKDVDEVQPLGFAEGPGAEGFVTDRNNRSFEERINAPDRPAANDTTGGKFGTWLDGPAKSGEDEFAPTIAPVRPGTMPRSLQVLRLDPSRPGAVHVLATGSGPKRSLVLYSVDAITGKLTRLAQDNVGADFDFLIDQQGAMRITVPNSARQSPPFRYAYLGRKAEGAGQPLGEALDERAGKFSIDAASFFGEREIPLGFDASGDVLYYATNRGRDTFALRSYNFATNRSGDTTFEHPVFDLISAPRDAFPPDTLVFDPHSGQLEGIRYEGAVRTTAWLRPDWREVQATLEHLFPNRAVDLLDWDAAARRFIVSTQGPADAGGFYVYDRQTKKLSAFARRAPWLDEQHTFGSVSFSYMRPDGVRITGLVTVPSQPRLKPIPIVVLCSDMPWQRVGSNFRADVHALTDMGFAVVQINGRGAWGFGLKHREALQTGGDLVQIEDIVATINELEKRFQVNRDRVALLGRGHGGFIALRALQAHPERFRCAIAIDPPIDLAAWLREQTWTDAPAFLQLARSAFGPAARLDAAPLKKHADLIQKPILLLSYPGPDGQPRRPQYAAARTFTAAANRHSEVTIEQLPLDYVRGLPRAQAKVFAEIEEFLNLNVYSYKVQPGEVREVAK